MTSLQLMYHLKWNPFASGIPDQSLLITPAVEHYFWGIENHMLLHGGFGLIEGETGSGKSSTMRLLATRLAGREDIIVAALTHASSRLADFYREMGELFGVHLSLHNRWGGFKALRERWFEHVETTRLRPLLLIDEAQELPAAVFSELRLLATTDFDSRAILSVVFAGDNRLKTRMQTPELRPIASRIRNRLVMEPATPEELARLLEHLLEQAGNPALMTPQVKVAICRHAGGNRRHLAIIGDMLLTAACQQQHQNIDEALFHQVFGDQTRRSKA